ncbi:MAG: flagellin [Chitinispirillales bacterium]|nr:flagellin [Chitinispirillales bacterium]
MRINTNVPAINAQRNLTETLLSGASTKQKLSSALRINKAGDDAAGLSISENMRGQIGGLNMASRNSSDTVSLIQTAEGALTESHSILQRMRELAVQSSNDTYTDADRNELQAEVKQLQSELTRIGNTTEFNTKALLNGSAGGAGDELGDAIMTQTGANSGQNMFLGIGDMRAGALGVEGVNVGTRNGAAAAIATLDSAIEAVSHQRGTLGAVQNGLEHTVRSIDVAAENTQAAESRIRDADMAKAVLENTRNNIMRQASLAMAAQANQKQQNVMSLLK